MPLSSCLILIGAGMVLGWEVRHYELDKRVLTALEASWETRIRKDAQIICEELYQPPKVNQLAST